MNPIHTLSLCPNVHPLLDRVLGLPVDEAIIENAIEYLCDVVKIQEPAVSTTTVSTIAKKKSSKDLKASTDAHELPPLDEFIENITTRSRSTMSTMLVVFVYLGRLKRLIHERHSPGKACSRHRVVFAAIMIAHKVWNDSSMVGKHWAEVSNLFDSREVLAMEREMLGLLKYDLNVTMEEVWWVATRFMSSPFIDLSDEDLNVLRIGPPSHGRVQLSEQRPPNATGNPGGIFGAILHHHPPYQTKSIHYHSSFDRKQPVSDAYALTRLTSSPAHSSDSSCNSFYSPIIQSRSFHGEVYFDAASPQPRVSSLSGISAPTAANPTIPFVSAIRQQNVPFVRAISALPTVRVSGRSKRGAAAAVHPYPVLAQSARLKKKKYLSSVQLLHLPNSVHPFSALRYHTASPLQYTSSSSSASSSSPSSFASSAYPQSPLLRYSRSQLKYQGYRRSTNVMNVSGGTRQSEVGLRGRVA